MDITEAEQALADWKQRNLQFTRELDQLIRDRDRLIRDAYAAGVNIRQIHLRSGVGRNTIYRILGVDEEAGAPRLVPSADPRDRIMKRLAGLPEEGGRQ